MDVIGFIALAIVLSYLTFALVVITLVGNGFSGFSKWEWGIVVVIACVLCLLWRQLFIYSPFEIVITRGG